MQQIQFAIIGCGKAAAIHAGQIKQFGFLKAVCDIDLRKGKQFAQLHKAEYYQVYKDLLKSEKELDVIVICTPNGLHAAQAIAAMKAGFHVLVEKPMALKVSDTKKMIAAAEQSQRHLFTVMQNRFNLPVQAVKKILNQQKLGRLYSVQLNCFWNRNAAYYKDAWHGTNELDGGILFTQFSHFIDILIWLFGMPKKLKSSCSNIAHNKTIEGADQGIVLFEWENGMLGSMHYSVNAYEKNREGSLTILAEKGMLKIGGAYLNELELAEIKGVKQPILNVDNKQLNYVATANDYGNYQGSMRNHQWVYKSLVDTLKRKKPYYTSSSEAAATIQLIQQIMKKHQ